MNIEISNDYRWPVNSVCLLSKRLLLKVLWGEKNDDLLKLKQTFKG